MATPASGRKRWPTGGRMIAFGGLSTEIPPGLLQSGAKYNTGVNNDIYEG